MNDKTPTAKETWLESNWFDRLILVAVFAAIWIGIFVRRDLFLAGFALTLTIWQWDDMGKNIELRRWRNAAVSNHTTTINISSADVDAAARKAQEYDVLRTLQHGRDS